jgi:hypothetical protein
MNGSRWIPLPYLACLALLALLGSSCTAAMAAPALWNDFAVLNLGAMLRDLQGPFLLGVVALGCVLAALLESSLRDPIA